MGSRSRNIVRETGTAFAVLAIYVLTLLLPLHQAAGLQRDLSRLGFAPTIEWSICGPAASGDTGQQDPTAVKCPAAGIAKHEFAAIVPTVAEVVLPLTVAVVHYAHVDLGHDDIRPDHFGQSRAPPVTV